MINTNYDRTHVTRSAGRRIQDKEMAKAMDKARGVFWLSVCAVFVLGVLFGVNMEKRNAQNVQAYQQEAR